MDDVLLDASLIEQLESIEAVGAEIDQLHQEVISGMEDGYGNAYGSVPYKIEMARIEHGEYTCSYKLAVDMIIMQSLSIFSLFRKMCVCF